MERSEYAEIFDEPQNGLERIRIRAFSFLLAVKAREVIGLASIAIGLALTQSASPTRALGWILGQSTLTVHTWQMFLILGGLITLITHTRFPMFSLAGAIPVTGFLSYVFQFYTLGSIWQFPAVIIITVFLFAALLLVRTPVIHNMVLIIRDLERTNYALAEENRRLLKEAENANTAGSELARS